MPNTKSAIRRVEGLRNRPRLTELDEVSIKMLLKKWKN